MVKSKVRFDGLDVAAMVAHWNRVALGRRVINIYNGPTGDMYLFKLDKPRQQQQKGNDTSSSSSHNMLLLESGIRFHTTNEAYETPGMPSPFCSKLRKHLRGLRLENIQQLGNKDRVVMLTFGSGETQRHSLILELYARGNLLLTNANFQILALLRSHDYEGAVKVQVGHAYPVTYATTTITASSPDEPSKTTFLESTNPLEWYQKHRPPVADSNNEQPAKGKKKKKGGGSADNTSNEWRSLLLLPESGISHYGPSLIDHCLLCADIRAKEQSPKTLDEETWKRLQSVCQNEGQRVIQNLDVEDTKGYIFYQPKTTNGANNDSPPDETKPSTPSRFEKKLLMDFQPHILKQHEGIPYLEYESFDDAVDAFFAHIEGQKRVMRAETQQAQAQQRLEKIRKDQKQRLDQLIQQQEVLKEQAQLVETHGDMVDKAIQVVNSALDSGMDWDQLEDLVELERTQNQNPVALLIHKLKLEDDSIVLRLEKLDYEDDSSEPQEQDASQRTMDVTISLKDTAFGNASALFAKYRASKEKGQKTIEASTKALQAAEENAQRQLLEAQKRTTHLTSNLQTKRKPLWFEKFNWFVTSDNYLVLAGRDAQQNEQLVKRYLRPGDAYLHADVHGASSCILRAKRRRLANGKTQAVPLSERALNEAGSFTICRSSAWSSRMVTSAWWVEAHQVSKTAPTGEYLTVGSFMVRGKKNFLPPSPLELGLAVLFRLGDDEAIARHKNERRDFALLQELEKEEHEEIAAPMAVSEAHVPATASSREIESSEVVGEEEESTAVAAVEEVDTPPLLAEPNEATADGATATDDSDGGEIQKISGPAEDVSNGETPDTEDTVSVATSNKSKKGFSVKERKLIKKYGSLEAAQEAEEERKRQEAERAQNAKTKPKKTVPAPAAPKRGKKAKMKRMAKKYADQDDEDRELALLALHAGERDKKSEKKTEPEMSESARAAAEQTMHLLKKDASLVADTLPTEVRETLAKCVTVKVQNSDEEESVVRWDKFDADVLEQLQSLDQEEAKIAAANRLLALKETTRVDNFSASLAGIIRTIRKYGHAGLETETVASGKDGKRKTKAERESEQENWKKTLAEEGVLDGDDLDDDAVDDTTELSKLTGKPHNDDLILFAVPVCAPYHTLSQYAYRVKLTPGNMKRGKAAKACLDLFLRDTNKSALADRNKECIKRVADTDWVQAIIGDVKISAAGASKAMQKAKAGKKGKKKK